MTTMTMPTVTDRSRPNHAHGESHLTPFLVAMVFLIVLGVMSVMISGPLH